MALSVWSAMESLTPWYFHFRVRYDSALQGVLGDASVTCLERASIA